MLVIFLGACAVDSGSLLKPGVDTVARDADLQTCVAEANQQMAAEADGPYPFSSPRYTYFGLRRSLFEPGASDDGSYIRRQIEGDIAAAQRASWRGRFGDCLQAHGYHNESSAGEKYRAGTN
mgnify:CR=1 FL=1